MVISASPSQLLRKVTSIRKTRYQLYSLLSFMFALSKRIFAWRPWIRRHRVSNGPYSLHLHPRLHVDLDDSIVLLTYGRVVACGRCCPSSQPAIAGTLCGYMLFRTLPVAEPFHYSKPCLDVCSATCRRIRNGFWKLSGTAVRRPR